MELKSDVKAVEVAANQGDTTSMLRHKGHDLGDGKTGHSFWSQKGFAEVRVVDKTLPTGSSLSEVGLS